LATIDAAATEALSASRLCQFVDDRVDIERVRLLLKLVASLEIDVLPGNRANFFGCLRILCIPGPFLVLQESREDRGVVKTCISSYDDSIALKDSRRGSKASALDLINYRQHLVMGDLTKVKVRQKYHRHCKVSIGA
jgi:hypothetical protein